MIWVVAAVLVFVSLFSALGALFFAVSEDRFKRITPFLISLSAGTIFGGVFIHLLFKLAATGYSRVTGLLIVVGVIGSVLLERAVHWHCHHHEIHSEPLPYVLATGDALHNVLDGILIATSFLASPSAGVAAVIAVIAHKIPKEFGDFGVMVEYGFSQAKALATNIGVSLFMFLGAAVVFGVASTAEASVPYMLALVIGNFVFIAGSDLLPAFKDEQDWWKHTIVFTAGASFMYLIPFIKAAIAA